mgnify:CR=1 FL=1
MDEVDEIIRAHQPGFGFWLVVTTMLITGLILLSFFPFAPQP